MIKLPLIIGVVLVLSYLPLAGGEDGFQIIVTKEDRNYLIGDTINVTIHVLNDGEYVEPDEVNVALGYPPDERKINTTESATGKYIASFQISEDDWKNESISVRVNVHYGDHEGYDSAYFNFQEEEPGLDVIIDVDKMIPSAGDTITITVTVLNNSENFDPEEIHLFLEVDDYWNDDFLEGGYHNDEKEELNLTKVAVGEYQAMSSIDSNDRTSHTYDLTAEVVDGDNYGESWVSFASKYYQIWYKRTTPSRGNETIDFGIYVADSDGNVVKGAEIWFKYEVVCFSDEETGERSGTTNENGYAVFSIPSCEKVEMLNIRGWVNDSYHQKFTSSIFFEDTEDLPDESDFDLIFHEQTMPYKPETRVSLQFNAYLNGEPIDGLPIYVYVFTYYDVLFHGKIIPNEGTFTLVFDTPAVSNLFPGIFVDMEFILNNSGEYEREFEYLYVSETGEFMEPDVELEVESVETYRDISLTIDDERFAGCHAFALVAPYPGEKVDITPENFFLIMESMDEDTNWIMMNEGFSFTLIYPYEIEESDNGKFSGTIHIPDFWKDNKNFIIIVMVVSPQTANFMHFGAKIIAIGNGSSTSPVDDKQDFIPGFQTVVVCVAVGCSLILHFTKRRKETKE